MSPDRQGFSFEKPPRQEVKEAPPKTEKEILWEQKQKQADKITDRLEMKIDEKIKDAVVSFWVHGFPTSMSCEGHLQEGQEEEHGNPFPWIGVEAVEPEGMDQNEEKKREWSMENMRHQKRMMEMLARFYQDRETPFDARLNFHPFGIFGAFHIQSMGCDVIGLLSPEEQKQKLKLYQQEMRDLGEFLKEKFFSEE